MRQRQILATKCQELFQLRLRTSLLLENRGYVRRQGARLRRIEKQQARAAGQHILDRTGVFISRCKTYHRLRQTTAKLPAGPL